MDADCRTKYLLKENKFVSLVKNVTRKEKLNYIFARDEGELV